MADEPGPPGDEEFDEDKKQLNRSSTDNKKDRDRRPSPSLRRRSPRRERRTRSKSRNRNYSPPRRYAGNNRYRRSPDRTARNRSRSRERYNRNRDPRRDRSRDRFRNSPRRHWSPNAKKPASPPLPPPIQTQPPPAPIPINPTTNPTQFSAPPPPIFNDSYPGYTSQYAGQTFPVPDYGAAPPPPPQFTASYPPPPAWSMPVPPAEVYGTQPPPAWPVTNPQIAATPLIQNPPQESNADQLKREAAVAQEVQNQREELKKQRNDYLKKASNMKKELKMLKDQMIDLIGSGGEPPSPTTKGYIDENEKLQGQIQKKINTIENVIDMLTGIIGVDKKAPTTPPAINTQKKLKKKKSSSSSSSSSDDNSSPERLKTKIIESMKNKREAVSAKDKIKEEIKTHDKSPIEKKINYIFYDPEMHWCQACNVFPKTAKDYLNHLHTKEHAKHTESHPSPWHDIPINDEFSNLPNAPSKRTPIRGLQFFVPSTSWFCKLCNFWMGDLHCASAHLKSKTHWECYNTFFQKNLTYEADWMAERQKSHDLQQRAPPPPPQITSSVSNSGMEIFDGIPLRINTQKSTDIEKSSKKRKKKSDDKKDKKKKKRSKKRKKGGSSSSSTSSSSSSSSSESDNEKDKAIKEIENRASSIRVAMRNVASEQTTVQLQIPYSLKGDSRGKWETINQPLPGTTDIKKKEDLILSQWNTPQPIISESEKKLLEQLKGKLKSKPIEDSKKNIENGSSKTDKRDENRNRSNKSPGVRRETSPSYRDRNNRSRSRGGKSNDRNRSDRRSRSRGRRSRSLDSRGRFKRSRSRNRRSRSRGRVSPYRRRRRSTSRDRRRRSLSRSRSRSTGRRIEKAIVRYPEFRPRVPEPEVKKKSTKTNNEDESERKKSPGSKKSSTNSANANSANNATNNNGSGKKLPFIGRMPLLAKKQQDAGNENSSEKKDDDNETNDDLTNMAHGYNYSNEAMMMQSGGGYPHYDHNMIDYDDLMPDPMQYVTLMGAPPPPPPPLPQQQYEDEKEILPPGIDETESEFVTKPISDAPVARKGPLPRDFEEALNIIFPGEKKPEDIQRELEQKAAEAEAATVAKKALQHAELAKDGIHLLNIEDTRAASMDDGSQMNLNDGFMKYSEHSQDVQDMALSDIPAPLPPPLPLPDDQVKPKEIEIVSNDAKKNIAEKEITKEIVLDDIKIPSPTNSDKERRQQELDDLAMLGIDADDLAAQCI